MEVRLSSREVAELSMEIEKNGRDFYSALAGLTDDQKAVAMFEYLADAEKTHRGVL